MGLLEEIKQRNRAVEKRVLEIEREADRMAVRVEAIERRLDRMINEHSGRPKSGVLLEKTGTIKRV